MTMPSSGRTTTRPDLERSISSVRDATTAMGEKVSDAADQVRAAAQDQYDSVARAVRRNPLQAVGIAAGVGFLLALVARR